MESKIRDTISKRTLEKSVPGVLVEMAAKKNSVNCTVWGTVEYFLIFCHK